MLKTMPLHERFVAKCQADIVMLLGKLWETAAEEKQKRGELQGQLLHFTWCKRVFLVVFTTQYKATMLKREICPACSFAPKPTARPPGLLPIKDLEVVLVREYQLALSVQANTWGTVPVSNRSFVADEPDSDTIKKIRLALLEQIASKVRVAQSETRCWDCVHGRKRDWKQKKLLLSW